ncbi:DUF2062 domain-containing protein [Roseobacter sp. YSTF-M11]|uniref:DUF2062 domain-containing protein n=1 Tax=Roseobacter insulae TaxID=2859783 RepID=A0A9X1FT58_9RHOB|nr:DUF2062 domain-containing protein [Roseobacter insulae]MBW4707285.1 DUF2062 domain-containing protein [Roseobacter insulae]
MVFKRRDPKSWPRALAEFLWPRGGWARAFHYVKHRMRRLPDSPERIARGIWAGVFASFTPFYGLHFFIAAGLATVMRGNVIASLMGTFFGNPLTYVPIGVAALSTGHWLLGDDMDERISRSFGGKFVDAGADLKDNFIAIFTNATADWSRLSVFYDEIFFPYMVGGILPGIVSATICYYLAVPVIRVYQKRRKGMIKAKFDALKAKAAAKADAKRNAEHSTGD